ncbi:YggT family protein [Niveibacterium sp. SC-1]|uniref:YggT family protein n=1 Tax=Niveibacterium sp. SC-1 TaxID=3135646 RepID=UPI0031203ACC
MLTGILLLLLNAAASFFTVLLLTRALMRWLRISFINPLGQFILATTDWAVRPMQKVLPSRGGLDLSCWVPAWLIQVLLVLATLWLGRHFEASPFMLAGVLLIGAVELMRNLLHLVMIVVIVAAVLSWVNPRAPLAPLVNALARPFLAPLARRLPPVGGVDLSPLVVLLIVQVLLFVLTNLHLRIAAAFLA